jgi:MEDS: MEthanogen/methylotroph, DcmR Sensory domain
MIYEGSPSRTLPAVAATIRQNLDVNARCMYMNSPTRVAGLRSQLYAAGTNVEHEVARRALVLAADTSHLVNGRFDVNRMIDMLEAAVERALADGYTGLFATGDMTWEFGSEKDFSMLLEYEWRLEQLFHKHAGLSGICQYHRDLLPHEAVLEGLVSHASLFISDTISRLNSHYVFARSPHERKDVASTGLDDALSRLVVEI